MIETKSAHITKVDEETIKVVFKTNIYLSYEEYDKFQDHYRSLIPQGKIKFLAIIQDGFHVEDGYIKFFKKYKTDFKFAEAFIIMPIITKTFFKAATRIVKPNYPAKMFRSEKEALSWLQSIKVHEEVG